MDLTIDPLKPGETPLLLELIRELAEFERLAHEVEATVDSLRESIFGEDAVAGALLARADGQVAGYAIYYFTFSSFVGRRGIWLDDVYVRPAFRRQGIGRGLIEAVGRIGVERDCGRYEWSALHWNKDAIGFYEKLGARVLSDWVMLRIDAAGMRRF